MTSSDAESEAAGRFRTAPDVIARSLGESSVLIRLSTSRIYELNATGARIWDLLVNGATRDGILEALEQEFGTADGISVAVDELLDRLRAEGLI